MDYGTVHGSVCGNPMCTHWYSGMGQTGGIAVWTVGQWVSLWESHVYPLVQWDGTDRWDGSMDYGTVNGNPIHAFCQASWWTCESPNVPVDISWQDCMDTTGQ